MSNIQPALPNFRRGREIFFSRPISLTLTLIIAVMICVISFLLLVFPVITAYYYAVSNSKREEFFIDLDNVAKTISFLFKGIKQYFLQSYLFALISVLPVLTLYLIPLMPIYLYGKQGLQISAFLQIIWIPLFFFFGSLLLYGYPQLIVSKSAIYAFKSTFAGIKRSPLVVFILGFLTLVPFTSFVFHLLMVFTYPILAGWGVSAVSDVGKPSQQEGTTRSENGAKATQEVTLGKLGIALTTAALMFMIIYGFSWLWGGTGFFIGLGISGLIGLYFGKWTGNLRRKD